ncbi:hypothetical protein BD311DRAFT_411973 [Dichomitus squalens]|uniref:Uncharacterized protein n=1 Tax=Dichomitus squalens TaxID=114155 RepID=A0A4Q9ML61_9APHY|nr:hypothetical protein BD311DRAFT_411973 [Dichomitus squalens]
MQAHELSRLTRLHITAAPPSGNRSRPRTGYVTKPRPSGCLAATAVLSIVGRQKFLPTASRVARLVKELSPAHRGVGAHRDLRRFPVAPIIAYLPAHDTPCIATDAPPCLGQVLRAQPRPLNMLLHVDSPHPFPVQRL